jgi:hypothetical protein
MRNQTERTTVFGLFSDAYKSSDSNGHSETRETRGCKMPCFEHIDVSEDRRPADDLGKRST